MSDRVQPLRDREQLPDGDRVPVTTSVRTAFARLGTMAIGDG
ncbi:MAG: hypothetical protein R3324_22045 [Halobacteriales archaeon]|nr:hypothetical protein [Halobacteriales archaeon]